MHIYVAHIYIYTHIFKKCLGLYDTHILPIAFSMCNCILKVTPGWHQSICSVYAVPPWDTQVVSHPGEHGAGPGAGGALPSRLLLGRPRCQLLCPCPPLLEKQGQWFHDPQPLPSLLGGSWPGQPWSSGRLSSPACCPVGQGHPRRGAEWAPLWPGNHELWQKQLGKPLSSRSLDRVWEVTGPTTGSWGHFLLIFIQRPLTPRPPFPRGPACPLTNAHWSVPHLHKPPPLLPVACRRHPSGTALSKAPLVALLPSVQPPAVAPSPSPPRRYGLRFSAWQGPAGARSQHWDSADLGQGSWPQRCFRVTLRRAGLGRPRITAPEPGRSCAARSHRG
nr:uncharacterized protein LOC131740382 [Kogia breviceps]